MDRDVPPQVAPVQTNPATGLPMIDLGRNYTVDQVNAITADAEELADIRAVDAAWEETDQLGETPVPWEDAKRDMELD